MQVGRTLLGAILGAAVGTAMLMAVYLTTGHDLVWLVIPFAIVTGLGVRLVETTIGHVSYARGALTALVAILGYIGAWACASQVMAVRAHAPRAGVVAETTAADAGDAAIEQERDAPERERDATELDGDTPAPNATATVSPADGATSAETPATRPGPSRGPEMPPTPAASKLTTTTRRIYRPIDIACMAVAAFIAYQFGRGTAAPASDAPVV
jgi:hypothetical protein